MSTSSASGSSSSVERLNEQLGLPGHLVFEAGPGNLPVAVITAPGGSGRLFLHGAHLADYRPAGAEDRPVLWMSDHSRYQAGEPIRGGIPICMPWFGPPTLEPWNTRTGGQGPAHGLARLQTWEITEVQPVADQVQLALTTRMDDLMLIYRVSIGRSLQLALIVANTGDETLPCEMALHTYFAVSDIRNIAIHGLEEVPFLDKVTDAPCPGDAQPIRFTGETDRVYASTQATCLIDDPGTAEETGRRIRIEKQGSRSTVVWNPWIAKSQRMPDFGDDEWPGMVCVETANVGTDAVLLAPGAAHEMSAIIRVIA